MCLDIFVWFSVQCLVLGVLVILEMWGQETYFSEVLEFEVALALLRS